MQSPLSFDGKIAWPAYVLSSGAAFLSQHLVTLSVFWIRGEKLGMDLGFYVAPLHSLATLYRPSDPLLLLIVTAALAYCIVATWALAALSFRRAADADIDEWVAAIAVAPVLQIPIILWLSVMPARDTPHSPPADAIGKAGWVGAAQGVLAGIALTLLAVSLGALVFGTYGYGMFMVSPFAVGALASYFANRKGTLGLAQTMALVAVATGLGGMALILVALEGVVCIVLASPLGLTVGRAAAQRARSASRTLSVVALLPAVFATEALWPSATTFETSQTIEIDAPPSLVWPSIVRMDMTGEPLPLPFRLGLAYPLRGEIVGEGVGAIRHGEFSTGVALERVTEWLPQRKLAFVVARDVPAIRELSLYEHVHAPHVIGYFRTGATSFELVPLPQGRTELIERTSHEIRLDPILYWLPMARWVVDTNNARVLAHIKRRAEKSRSDGL